MEVPEDMRTQSSDKFFYSTNIQTRDSPLNFQPFGHKNILKSAVSLRAPRIGSHGGRCRGLRDNAYVKLNGRASLGRITVLNAIFTARRGDPCRFTNGDSAEQNDP